MESVINLFREIYLRLTSDTPKFFARLRAFCISVALFCFSMQKEIALFIEKITDSGVVPQIWLTNLSGYVMAGAAVGAIVSSLMVKDYAPIAKLKDEARTDEPPVQL